MTSEDSGSESESDEEDRNAQQEPGYFEEQQQIKDRWASAVLRSCHVSLENFFYL